MSVAIGDDDGPLRYLVVPRDHVAAAAWIEHLNWLTDPSVAPGVRNVEPEHSLATFTTFAGHENTWASLAVPTDEVPVPPMRRGDRARRPS